MRLGGPYRILSKSPVSVRFREAECPLQNAADYLRDGNRCLQLQITLHEGQRATRKQYSSALRMHFT
ncbi:MAG: hypothetical protein ACI841_004639 [Planctomycetota bacterium]|jgi:hypothetical protein